MHPELRRAVLPVIDIKNSRVVHAVAGQRNSYDSIRTLGLDDDAPGFVADWYQRHYGLSSFYLADLDAIAGAEPAIELYARLLDVADHLYLDSAWDPTRLDALTHEPLLADKITPVIGLESILSLEQLEPSVSACPYPPIFSLDLQDGKILNPRLSRRSVRDCVGAAANAGFKTILILDLADVGTERGNSATRLLSDLQPHYPHIEWWTGGGIRDSADIRSLLQAGFRRLLLGTALYRRRGVAWDG